MNTSAPLNPSTWVLGKLYSRRSPCVVITTISPQYRVYVSCILAILRSDIFVYNCFPIDDSIRQLLSSTIVHNEVFKNLVRTKKVSLMYIIVAKGARIAACQKSVELA